MKWLAYIRLRFRRARLWLFGLGFSLSCWLLFFATAMPWNYRNQAGAWFVGQDEYVKFLFLNPPAVITQEFLKRATQMTSTVADGAFFLTSFVWWAAIAIVFRRRHAKVLVNILPNSAKSK